MFGTLHKPLLVMLVEWMLIRNLGMEVLSLSSLKICKGDNLTHFYRGIPEVQMIWSKSGSSSTHESKMVSQ